jgi:hypothetical protein
VKAGRRGALPMQLLDLFRQRGLVLVTQQLLDQTRQTS